jgi:hypothetical protein
MDALVYYKVINNVTKKCTTLQARAIVLATENVIHNSKLMHQTNRDDVPLLAREGGGGSAASAWRNVCYVQPTCLQKAWLGMRVLQKLLRSLSHHGALGWTHPPQFGSV